MGHGKIETSFWQCNRESVKGAKCPLGAISGRSDDYSFRSAYCLKADIGATFDLRNAPPALFPTGGIHEHAGEVEAGALAALVGVEYLQLAVSG